MKKRGLTSLVAIVLLILIAIMAVFIVYNVVKIFIEKKTGEAGETLTCLTNVDLSLINSCYSSSQIKFTIKNNNNFDYKTDFFILRVIREEITLDVPTNWHSTLHGLEQKEFIADIDEPGKADEFIFIPKIKEEKGYCYGQAITFKPDKCV